MPWSIFDFDQHKPLRFGGTGRDGTVFALEDLTHTAFGQLAAASLQQRSDDIADHLVKKAVGFDVDMDKITLFRDLNPADRAHRDGLFIPRRVRGLEGLKIVPADQGLGLGPHRTQVQRIRIEKAESPLHGATCRTIQDRIPINFGFDAKTCVKTRPHLFDTDNRDVFGEIGIEGGLNGRDGKFGLGVKIGNLPQRVDAAVGAAGPKERDVLLEDLF